jgi:hypothetical protein
MIIFLRSVLLAMQEYHHQAPSFDNLMSWVGDDPFDPIPISPARLEETYRKPIDKPKRPISAYNLFFQMEHLKIIGDDRHVKTSRGKSRGSNKVGFAELARTVSQRWKVVDPTTRLRLSEISNQDKFRYRKDMDEYKRLKREEENREHKVTPEAHGDGIVELANQLDREAVNFIISTFL